MWKTKRLLDAVEYVNQAGPESVGQFSKSPNYQDLGLSGQNRKELFSNIVAIQDFDKDNHTVNDVEY
jgi:hypothetical protein